MCHGTYGPGVSIPGGSPNGGDAGRIVCCQNTGLFVYKFRRKAKHVTDGLSKTFAAGELVGGDQTNGHSAWAYGSRHESSLRTTTSPLNTPPGTGANVRNESWGILNGAFGSEHAGGGNFVFADGSVDFVNEEINYDVYQDFATIASQPHVP